MAKTKYDELKDAYNSNAALFKDYENDCRKFISDLRQGLINYLGCSQSEVEWPQFAKDESIDSLQANNILEIAFDRSMALQSDAYYQFRLRVLFDAEWVDLNLRAKKTNEGFTVKLGGDKRVIGSQREELNTLVQHLFSLVKEYFDTRFTDFIQERKSRLGFITP
jgi:hypothetical protein